VPGITSKIASVEAQEIDASLDELETRLDRLRALYEQYFLGIERIEPQIARKDVDRRFWILRRTQIRNTARRFRLQVLIQRYNTLAQYWQRICREIENGTYVRHLLKAKKRLGAEPKTWAAKKRLGMFRKDRKPEGEAEGAEGVEAGQVDGLTDEGATNEGDLSGLLTGGDLDREVMAATAAAFEKIERGAPATDGASVGRFVLDDLGPLNLEFDDDNQPTLHPPPRVASSKPPTAGAPATTSRVATPGKMATLPPPVAIGGKTTDAGARAPDANRPRPPLPTRPRLPDAAAPTPVAGDGPARPAPVAGASPNPARPPLPARPALPNNAARDLPPGAVREPAAPFPPAPSSPSSSPPGAPFPPAPSSPISSAPPPRPRMPLPHAGARSLPGPNASAARPPVPSGASSNTGPRPQTGAAAGAATRLGAVPLPRPLSPAGTSAGVPKPAAPSPAAAAAPRAPITANPVAPAPRAASSAGQALSDDRLKQLHHELTETKKKLNAPNNVSLDSLARSLRDTEQKLRAEHGGRAVDFQVVVKDGKAVVKPIVRKA
jgi:hypothetical protein